MQIIHIDANNTICNLHTYITSNNIHKQFITNKKFYWQLNNKSMPVLLSNKVHTQPYVFKNRAQILTIKKKKEYIFIYLLDSNCLIFKCNDSHARTDENEITITCRDKNSVKYMLMLSGLLKKLL